MCGCRDRVSGALVQTVIEINDRLVFVPNGSIAKKVRIGTTSSTVHIEKKNRKKQEVGHDHSFES